MAKRIKDNKLLYHLTALDNLESIFRNGLLSRNDVLKRNLLTVDIADDDIIQKRILLKIDDYIPFHFFEPTAFTGAIWKNYPLKKFCTIAITRDFAKINNFKICTSHPLSNNAKILNYEEGFNTINWEKAELRNFKDKECKNACLAECLATSPLFPDDFFSIYVSDETTAKYIDELATEIIGFYKFEIQINQYIAGKS